uniref:Uncharacterized protein n=2 Tax=Candidatus Kentrum sp. TUN TaxID=2126343 RepID=A0A451A8U4_9GAMM|nr:MAG: hypothetical protein BECKTUN1418D_GA0071000_11765 [Candidatus Kentron sp. TUN]
MNNSIAAYYRTFRRIDFIILFISRSALRMSYPLAGPCQQGKQNPRESSMRFLRCRKTREKPQYAPSVLNGKCQLSKYAQVEPSIIGIQPCRRAGLPVALWYAY